MASSPDPQAQRSVFISYSRHDDALARRVHDALAARGIFAWFDQAEIQPGAPDWENAIRAAIKQSHALILIASPNSRESRYVRDELDLAEAHQRPVYPLWAVGERWIESVPLGWGRAQFIDVRGANEYAGTQMLIAALAKLLPPQGHVPIADAANQNREVPVRLAPRQGAASIVGTLLTTLKGHTGAIWAVAWSPDGARLASVGNDQAVRLWNIASRKHIAALSGHTNWVYAVVWSPDGRRLASASADQTVRLWEVISGQPLGTLSGHSNSVNAVAWSPDGLRLASAGVDKTVRLWDVTGRKMLLTLSGHTDTVQATTWSPDGSRLASASYDMTVRLWDTTSRKHLVTLSGHSNLVQAVAWSPNGAFLATASTDQTVRLWDAISGKHLATLSDHTDAVRSVVWSPDSLYLASASRDQTVRIWKV